MKQTVYVDVLLALNFIADYFLILGTQIFCRRKINRKRILAGALTGSLFSLTIFLPQMSPLEGNLCRLISSALMMGISDRWHSWKRFLYGCIILFGVTFLFGGIMLALRIVGGPGRLLCANGVVYLHMSPMVLIGNITLCFLILRLIRRLDSGEAIPSVICPVTLCIENKTIRLHGLVDTGNHLTEPFSGLPVIVAGRDDIKAILPPYAGELSEESCIKNNMRLIPYRGVGSGGVLPAVRGDWIQISTVRGTFTAEEFYVAISREPVGNKEYQILLSKELTDTGKERMGAICSGPF